MMVSFQDKKFAYRVEMEEVDAELDRVELDTVTLALLDTRAS